MKSPQPHGLHGAFNHGVASDHDDFHIRLAGAYRLEHFHAVHARHGYIGNDHVKILLGQQFQAFFATARLSRFMPAALQGAREVGAGHALIVNDQQTATAASPLRGVKPVTAVPTFAGGSRCG